jgi:hypothetical protein
MLTARPVRDNLSELQHFLPHANHAAKKTTDH